MSDGIVWPVGTTANPAIFQGRGLRTAQMAPALPGARALRPLGGISGVRYGTPATTVAVSGSTCTVHPHAGTLDVEAAAEAGPYGFSIPADVARAVPPAHATLARWDGVYVCLDDPAESDGSAAPGVRVEYVAGTPAASPAMPTAPDRSLLLARVVVPQSGGGSPSVVWLARRLPTVTWPVRDDADRDALAAILVPSVEAPLTVEHTGGAKSGQLERNAGSGWGPLGPIPDVSAVIQTAQVASGTVLASLVLPALGVATTASISVIGQAGFSGAAVTVGVVIAASAGTLTQAQASQVQAASAQYAAVASGALLALPAGTAATITITSASSAAAYWRGLATARRQIG